LFVTDSSNLANDFSRNKLRNIVIPAFENQFPNLRKGLIRTARNLSETAELYEAMLSEKRAQYTSVNHTIRLSELIASEHNPSLILYEWFKPLGLTRTQASDIVASAAATGSRFLTPHATFIIDRGTLIIHSGPDSHLPSISDFRFETLPIADFQPVNDRRTALFSTDILRGETPTVRQWRTADRIQPFGMKGTKKVSDIFSDAKIPLSSKSWIPLLIKDDKILWVTGLRQSAKLKVKPSDTHFVKVTYLGPDLF
ncbi:MAG: tRNA lysidine(34) synthetase TilS, partial [Paramuribaculum sp.]|nr:tRNA lysidine(34) synthetase TilS [Paramuribaculum sp.]